MIRKVSVSKKIDEVDEFWKPQIIGQIDDYQVKIVKIKDEFEMHHHDNEDEMFLILNGKLTIITEEKDIELKEGELVVIPSGINHKPTAKEETYVLLFEKESTKRKGD